MSTVVQATCPGCKKVLRIPAHWLNQAIRCKYCRMVIQARPDGAPAAPPAPPSAPARSAPLPVAEVAAPVPVAAPPAAVPIAGLAAEPGSPFADFDDPDAPPRRRYHRRRSSGWVGLVLGLVLLGGAGGAAYALWPELSKLFEGKPSEQTKIEPGKDRSGKDRSGKDGPRPGPVDPTKPNSDGAFPRRALLVSVHNYLYANPVNYGNLESGGRNFQTLVGRLSEVKGFRIAPTQIAYLSDAAREPVPPVKAVIEETIASFLKGSRPQDRVLLLFAGHGVEVDGKPYLVPIEGELGVAATLIPLEWVYKHLADCKARQKLLVLDVCRFNPARGLERPAGGTMGEKFDLALQKPPPGVQVWASCTRGQQSYEFEDDKINNGLFMDCFYEAAARGVDGTIQKPDDPFPVGPLVDRVNRRMSDELAPYKLAQASRLTGEEPELGAPFDPDADPAPRPGVARADKGRGVAEARLVRALFRELNVPPVKKSQSEGLLRYESLPPFQAKVLDTYPIDNTPSPLRDAIERAQAVLWSISASEPPADLADAVRKFKQSERIQGDVASLPDSFRAPSGAGEMRFKAELENINRGIARVLRVLEEEALPELEKVGAMRDQAPKRWQANYDFMLARVKSQIAYVYEYASMIGQARKELPARDAAIHNGWRLASRDRLQGDSTGRKHGTQASKLLDKIVKEHAGTPWEVLAKREKLTALGLQWMPEK